ncbi:MAG: Uncharacterised protein [Pseudidiomarina mangrovi]|nr:MAG: Uncharacterised protein [Pseudidiomarina mangrovi]
MQHFPSKVDSWLRVVLSVTAVVCFATAIWHLSLPEAEQMTWFTVALLLAGGLCLWIMTSTYYRIYDDLLLIRSGPFRRHLRIGSIMHVRPSSNPLANPALSLDRIELTYGKHGKILISPLEPLLFVQALQHCETFHGDIDPSLTTESDA